MWTRQRIVARLFEIRDPDTITLERAHVAQIARLAAPHGARLPVGDVGGKAAVIP